MATTPFWVSLARLRRILSFFPVMSRTGEMSSINQNSTTTSSGGPRYRYPRPCVSLRHGWPPVLKRFPL